MKEHYISYGVLSKIVNFKNPIALKCIIKILFSNLSQILNKLQNYYFQKLMETGGEILYCSIACFLIFAIEFFPLRSYSFLILSPLLQLLN